MNKKRSISLVLAGALSLSAVLPCYASTEEEIGAVEQQQEETQAALNDTEERIAALEVAKGESENYLSELSTQLGELTANLQSLEDAYQESVVRLDGIKADLASAEADEDEQYDAMKLRIQYMYENMAGNGMLSNLFAAEDFSDFLNRASMVSELTSYDREMLSTYQDTVVEVKEKKAEAESEQAEINRLQQETAAQQEEVQEIYELTYNDLMDYAASLDSAQSEEASLVEQIQEQQEMLDELLVQQMNEQLEAQRKAEEEAAAAAAAEAAAQAAETASDTAESQPAAAASSEDDTQQTATDTEQTAEEAAAEESTEAAEAAEETTSSADGQGTYLGCFTLTAYCACSKCCGAYASGHTASGTVPQQGVTVAMGGVPFGTQLSINGHVYTVEDRGTAYGHVDIFFNNHAEALAFGMKSADVYQLN